MSQVDRQRVRRSFGNQAGAYDDAAMVQKVVVERVLSLAKEEVATPPGRLLDIGCGTGLLLERLGAMWPSSLLAGCDLAPGMCAAAAARSGGERFHLTCADCEQLPYGDGIFDLVLSTSTFQWLETLHTAFSEARRVMLPEGVFLFALFGADTLYELKASWRHSLQTKERHGDGLHRFPTAGEVEEALKRSGYNSYRTLVESETEYYVDVPDLLRNLKRIGAGNAVAGRKGGLGDRGPMLAMMEYYQRRYGDGERIPATYEVVYGIAHN